MSEDNGFYDRVKQAHVVPLWRVPGTDSPEPDPIEVPYVWHWNELIPLIEEAAEVVDLGTDSDRRALNATNPGRAWGTTQTMIAGYQLVMPGESAPAHRHTPAAIRLMLSGSGQTVVEGEPVTMERGDLVLTPAWTWHDHRNDGDVPMVWLDGLDVPFIKHLHAQFYEDFEGKQLQPTPLADSASVERFGQGLVPRGLAHDRPHSPLTKYPIGTTVDSLERLRQSMGDPEHGVSIDYVNPLTGGPVMPTMACAMTLLPAGRTGERTRHTSSTIFCPVRGDGYSIIGGERFDWSERDFFVVPTWTWYEHHACDGSDVLLFEMSDRPVYEAFDIYREEHGA